MADRKIGKFPVKKINMKIRKKLAGLFFAVMLALVALLVVIINIHVTAGDLYTRIVLSNTQQQYQSRTLPFKRGDILDRNGSILATSERVYNLILDCAVINTEVKDEDGNVSTPYIEPTLNALSEIMNISRSEVEPLLKSEKTKDSRYYILHKNIPMAKKEAWEKYTDLSNEELTKDEIAKRKYVAGIWFEESYRRVYPQNSLACDTIGFCNSSNEASWGIEGYYNDVLNGIDGRVFGYFNSESNVEQSTVAPVDGDTVVSTIDVNIQQIVRTAIEDYMQSHANGPDGKRGAKNVAVLVMDPRNGEVLAMDSTDWYDLNNPQDMSGIYDESTIKSMSDEERLEALNKMWRNYCISDAFEPGSVAKPVTVAAALETDSIKYDDKFYCDGYEFVSDQLIRCSEFPDFHGELDAAGSLSHSCNDCIMQIAVKEGSESLVKYQDIFNFGRKTGIDLPGESSGITFTADSMGELELATSSFGQGFTCTMIQEACAMASIINGGYYYKPHTVKSLADSNGNIIENYDSVLEKQTVSQEISDYIKAALGDCVEQGTGTYAKVAGYSMGGKTGTAQKIPRDSGKYLVSFIGFAPLENPEIMVYVTVDEPNTYDEEVSSIYAQDISRQIFTELLPYLKLFPDQPVIAMPQESGNDEEGHQEDEYSDETEAVAADDGGEQPAEGQPAEGEQPAEAQPAEGQPAEGQPAEEQSAEEQPAEGQPAEGEQPAEEQSVEGQPAEGGQPAEEQPAEAAPAEEQAVEREPGVEYVPEDMVLPEPPAAEPEDDTGGEEGYYSDGIE